MPNNINIISYYKHANNIDITLYKKGKKYIVLMRVENDRDKNNYDDLKLARTSFSNLIMIIVSNCG